MIKLKFKKLDARAVLPSYAHDGDSGMDIYCLDDIRIRPHGFDKVRTGIAAAIPAEYELQVRPRSGLSAKQGVVAAFGTIDSGYRGEIGVTLFNHNTDSAYIKAGDRVAQLVIAPVVHAHIEETESLDITERGADGFGSTGR